MNIDHMEITTILLEICNYTSIYYLNHSQNNSKASYVAECSTNKHCRVIYQIFLMDFEIQFTWTTLYYVITCGIHSCGYLLALMCLHERNVLCSGSLDMQLISLCTCTEGLYYMHAAQCSYILYMYIIIFPFQAFYQMLLSLHRMSPCLHRTQAVLILI